MKTEQQIGKGTGEGGNVVTKDVYCWHIQIRVQPELTLPCIA